ncbi:hypothetical protein JX265_010976 [Neoarthrinium moseri]|uniref:Transmembrane protein n=1 Tax=Neoarthrinium moseri TaxID=1658444 RepID=A0A9P9WD88_9PEZI|nr:hypothetical protein JX266_003204 [Neoarthrinium moseri]KAI1857946.1 hypothetical protein JX265_010976 [Neoarthrinium moseri]
MRNPISVLREQYELAQFKLAHSRHPRAWGWLLAIVAIAVLGVIGMLPTQLASSYARAVLNTGGDGMKGLTGFMVSDPAIVYAIVVETNHQGIPPIDHDNGTSALHDAQRSLPLMSVDINATNLMSSPVLVVEDNTPSSSTLVLTNQLRQSDATTAPTAACQTQSSGIVNLAKNMDCNVNEPRLANTTTTRVAAREAQVQTSNCHCSVKSPYPEAWRNFQLWIAAWKELYVRLGNVTVLWRVQLANWLNPKVGDDFVRRLAKGCEKCELVRDLRHHNEQLRAGLQKATDLAAMQKELLYAQKHLIQQQRRQLYDADRFNVRWALQAKRLLRQSPCGTYYLE